MAYYFNLTKKGEQTPTSLNKLDEEICELLGVEVHPKKYGGVFEENKSFNWFDTIGFQLASGKSLKDGENSVRGHYSNNEDWKDCLERINKIIDFLQSNYEEDK